MSASGAADASRLTATPTALGVRPSDAVLGAVATGKDAAVQAAEYGTTLVGIAARLAWHGSAPVRAMVPRRYRAAAHNVVAAVEGHLRFRVAELARRGDAERRQQGGLVSELLDRLVPLIVVEVVERIDVTRLVTENVDLDAIAARIDVAAIAERLDLAAITDQVLDEIDLPEIIRSSSGSLASNAVVGVRRRGIEADDIVTGVVDRLLRRNRR